MYHHKITISHCTSILQVCTIHGARPTEFDFLRRTFPLKILEMLSPSQEQRKEAKKVTEKWGLFMRLEAF